MKFRLLLVSLLLCAVVSGQGTGKRALFIGNSYTYVNNLPQMIADMALSMSDTLVFDSNTPGGYRLNEHTTNATTLAKIRAGNWDYVVLQEQSQYPSFSDQQVKVHVFPYAYILDTIIKAENPCAETVFYMTWGRKNGDASNCSTFPAVCTYAGMDSMLNLRYRMMADSNDGIISPVGAVWKYLRQNFPLIELYQTDESHPSVAGTYAAACCFYTTFFRRDPSLITFNSTLSATDAANIRAAAKAVVYDTLTEWHIGAHDPSADFSYADTAGLQVSFRNHSTNAADYLWDFGDGNTSADSSPVHTYLSGGTFHVKLLAGRCGAQDSVTQIINTVVLSLQTQLNERGGLNVYPRPAEDRINLNADAALVGSDYSIYDSRGKAVLTGKIDSENTVVSVEGLRSGVYFLSVAGNMKRVIKR